MAGGFRLLGAYQAPTGAALVGPHANWTGTLGTGSAAPTAVATGSATKPFASFIVGQHLDRFSSDYLIGVMAFASAANLTAGAADITSVVLSGDVATTTQTTPSVQTIAHPSGVGTVTALAYWFRLTRSQFTSVSNSGQINVYAKVTAADPTMVPRVIGGDGFGGGGSGAPATGWTVAEFIPLQLYPRTTQYDWDKTVGSGRDFATLDLALADLTLNSRTVESPRFTIMDSGTQTVTSHFGSMYNNAKGYCVITTGTGITATIVRNAAFDPLNSSESWDWWTGCNQIKFEGPGLTVDIKTFWQMKGDIKEKPYWFYGCNITNSIGGTGRSLSAVYWNGGPPDPFSIKYFIYSDPLPSYFDGCTITNAGVGSGCHRFAFNSATTIWTCRMDGTRLIAYNTLTDIGTDPMYPAPYYWGDRITLTYSGPATVATATVTGTSIEVFEDGVASFTKVQWPYGGDYRPYQAASGGNAGQKVSEAVSLFNSRATAAGGRWTAAMIGTDAGGPWASYFNNNTSVTKQLKPGAGTANWQAGIDAHTEFQKPTYASGGANFPDNDNYCIYANRFLGYAFSTSFMNCDNVGTLIIVNNVGTYSTIANEALGRSSSYPGQHIVVENNTMPDGYRPGNVNVGMGTWSSVRCNNFGLELSKIEGGAGDGTWGSYPIRKGNFSAQGVIGTPGGTYDASNTTLANMAAWQATMADFAGGDYRPAPGGVLPGVTLVPSQRYDINNNLRNAAGDVAGAFRLAP